MTVLGLIGILAAFYACVEVMAFAARQPTGIVNQTPSPVADKPWLSRLYGLIVILVILAVMAAICGLVLGIIALANSGFLGQRIT